MIALPDISSLESQGVNWLGLAIVLVASVLGAWLIPRIAVAVLARRLRGRRSGDIDVHRRAKRADTLLGVVRSLARYGAIVAGVLALFIFAFPDTGSTVLGVSLLVAIVGFAAQSVLRDVIAGTMMVSERWFDVGDAITVEPWAMSGVVESITLRSTRLRGIGGESVRIHNGQMFGVRVARNGIREIVLEAYVADADAGRALFERLSALLPSGPMHLLSTGLRIEEEEQLGDLTRLAARGAVPPGREWLLESFAIDLLRELDRDGVIRHGPIAYFSDPIAEQRFARTVAPALDVDGA